MAGPIEATPILSGKDAERLHREAQRPVVISPAKAEELDRCVSLYEKFLERLNK